MKNVIIEEKTLYKENIRKKKKRKKKKNCVFYISFSYWDEKIYKSGKSNLDS